MPVTFNKAEIPESFILCCERNLGVSFGKISFFYREPVAPIPVALAN